MPARRFASLTAAALGLMSLDGCTIEQAAEADVAQAVERWQRRRVLLTADAPPKLLSVPANEGAGHGDDPSDEQTSLDRSPSAVRGYILEALRKNPSVQAAIENVQAKLQRIAQITALDDPILKLITRPEPIQTAAGDIVFTLGISQKIPLPTKLDAKGHMAAAEVRMSIERLNATRLRLIADVERGYQRLYVADRSIELTAENVALLEDLERVVDAQYRVGRVKQEDLLRIQIELADLVNQQSIYRRQRESAVAALNELMNRPTTNDLAVTQPAGLKEIDVRIDELTALAANHNPELAALAHQEDRDREAVLLADLAYWPDLDLGVEWNKGDDRRPFIPPVNSTTGVRPPFNNASAQGDDNWALTVGLNLPIWAQRIEAARREARHQLERTRREQQAASNLVAFRIHDAWVRVQTRQDTIRLLQSTLIPQGRQTYEVSLASYQGGESDFLTVIENWRQLLGFELMLHRETAGLEVACSDLQREVGLQLIRRDVAPSTPRPEVQP